MIKIGLDALGGDLGVNATVPGAMEAIKEMKDIEIVLYGDEAKIKPLLTNSERISIVHTDKAIDMGEHDPVKAIRTMKDSSLVMALKAGKDHEVDGVVTTGPTQCVVVGCHLIVRKIEGMQRIALCPLIANYDNKPRLLLDAGANVELKPEHINELATFASSVAEVVLDVKSPSIGLLNIGTEEGKGREVDKETYEVLKNNKNINFYGNVEPFAILNSPCHVLITDGFSGNMCIKSVEGTAKVMSKMLKDEIYSSFKGKIGGLLLKKNLNRFKKKMDTSEVGGAMVLGLPIPVVKAHGNSEAHGVMCAIRQVRNMVSSDVIAKAILKLKKGDSIGEDK